MSDRSSPFQFDFPHFDDTYGCYLQLEQEVLIHPAMDIYRFLFGTSTYRNEDRYSYEEIMLREHETKYREKDGYIEMECVDVNTTSPLVVEKSIDIGMKLRRIPLRNLDEMLNILRMLRNQLFLNELFLDYVQNAKQHSEIRVDLCSLGIIAWNTIRLRVLIAGTLFEILLEVDDGTSLSIKSRSKDCPSLSDEDIREALTQPPSLFKILRTYIDMCRLVVMRPYDDGPPQ
jgi:hypothetical protein